MVRGRGKAGKAKGRGRGKGDDPWAQNAWENDTADAGSVLGSEPESQLGGKGWGKQQQQQHQAPPPEQGLPEWAAYLPGKGQGGKPDQRFYATDRNVPKLEGKHAREFRDYVREVGRASCRERV